jgi:adenylate kinase
MRRLLARGRGSDDTPEVISHRLEVFEARTLPMLAYYAEREVLVTVNGARPVKEVAWSIAVQLQALRKRA